VLETYGWKTPFWVLAGGLVVVYCLFQRLAATPACAVPRATGHIARAQEEMLGRSVSLGDIVKIIESPGPKPGSGR